MVEEIRHQSVQYRLLMSYNAMPRSSGEARLIHTWEGILRYHRCPMKKRLQSKPMSREELINHA